jgi:hypothetical protein
MNPFPAAQADGLPTTTHICAQLPSFDRSPKIDRGETPMKRLRVLSLFRSKPVTAVVFVLMLLVGAFPASANYEHYEEYRVAYEYGGESCTQVMVTYRCTVDPADGVGICEVIGRNCLG